MKDFNTLKWIFKKTKSQNLNFMLLNIIYITYSVLNIYLILISKNLIDSAMSQSILELKKYVLQLIIISLTEIALKSILSSIDAITRAKLEINFKQDVLNIILKRNYEKVSKYHSGDLMTRIVSDVNIIIDTLVSLIPNILSMITKLLCALILLFQISKEFVIVLVTAGIILFIVINIFKPYLKKLHKKVQEASSDVRLFFKEVFENLIVIKIFQAENEINNKSLELQDKKYDIQMKRKNISVISGTGYNLIFQGSYLYALIWSSYKLYQKNITVGGLTSIVQLIAQVQAPIIGLSRSFQNIFMMLASAERIMELENIEEDISSQNINRDELYSNLNSIIINNLNFNYDNKKIFENLNLEIKKGEIVGIFGESGIGKSTLLKLILGIIEQDTGEIYFNLNNNTKQKISNETKNMFTYVPQGKFILSGTIRENLTFVNKNISEEDLNNALIVSQSKEFIDELENGLDTKIGERGKGLSEGQIQRLAIARALVSQAPILVLDEITSSLDSKTENEILNNIKNLKNKTCIIVTHRNSISQICDKEFIVENNNIKEKVN